MKKLTLIIAVLFMGCGKGERQPKIIVSKSYTTFWGTAMPNGIARYYYQEWSNADAQEFQDSCGMYNIGDTIK